MNLRRILLLRQIYSYKTGKAKSIRFSTLESICQELQCQPRDILEWVEEK